MKIIKPSYEIMYYNKDTMPLLEKVARVCYKSEDKICDGSADILIQKLINSGHEAMIEHASITVKFIHNRGFSHELVRHRIASYAQESTRYCNYSADKFGNELTFIEPYWFQNEKYLSESIWMNNIDIIEKSYFQLLEEGLPPQAARGILPNDLKTEIVITANIREWRQIFKLRTANAAHPDMIRVMLPLQIKLQELFPILF